MKRRVLFFATAAAVLGAIIAVAHVMMKDWAYPFGYSFEVIWDAPFMALGRAFGLQEGRKPWTWGLLEIGLNTFLCSVVGVVFGLLVHVYRTEWGEWLRERDISRTHRMALLAMAWGATCIACLAAGRITSLREFVFATLWFPLANIFFLRVPWAHPLVGWLVYISLTIAAGCVRKLGWYGILYGILCFMLILNIVGCHSLPPPGTHLM